MCALNQNKILYIKMHFYDHECKMTISDSIWNPGWNCGGIDKTCSGGFTGKGQEINS